MGRASLKILQSEWPAGMADALGFDKAQLAALKQGLTKELAIIQGPPGTGKTFLGTVLVKLVLANLNRSPGLDLNLNQDSEDHVLTGPIQIICQTNHALDQFLEGLYKSGITELIRIGGRSKSDVLKERTLFHLLERQREARKLDGSYRRLFGQERARKDSLEEQIHTEIDKLGQKLVTIISLKGIATAKQIDSLFGLGWISNGPLSMQLVEIWLNQEWCVDGSMAMHYVLDEPTDELKPEGFGWERVPGGRKARGAMKMLPKSEDDNEGGWRQARPRRRNRRRRALAEDEAAFQVQEDVDDHDGVVMLQDEGELADNGRRVDDHLGMEVEDPLHAFVDATNLWHLNMSQRRRLHEHWMNEIRSNCRRELRNLTKEYEQASKNVLEVENEIQLAMLRSARVVGMTTTAAAKYHEVLKSLKSEIVVIEEAAEVLEAHILACLSPSVKHLILIGDHKQLRPSVAVYKLVTECKLDVSMFERLVRSRIEHVTLEEQRRIRPTISKLMKGLYPKSRDHLSVHKRKDVSGVAQNVFFFDHKAEERNSKGEEGSKVNPVEARLVVELCMYLLNQPEYGPENITILTMYGGQLAEIRKLLKERCKNRSSVRPIQKIRLIEEESNEVEDIVQIPRVSSVDDFQGEESDIIILSLVSSEIETKHGIGKIGFLKIDNRVCVALTRARDGLFVFGNATLLADNSELWKTVTDNLRDDGALGQQLELYCENHPHTRTRITRVEDFKQVEDGGCNLACEFQLDCGHACPRRCHRASHDLVICLKPCLKQHENCVHTCNQRCHGESSCPPCRTIVTRKLIDCNHEQTMICESKIEDEVCRSTCDKKLPCGHQCRMLCGRPCTENCQEPVKRMLPCGHLATIFCYQSVETVSCTVPCGDLLECEHPCQGTCGKCKNRAAHVDCMKKCGRSLPCGHSCEDKCYVSCPPCEKRCQKRCLHSRCQRPCGEPCIPCREPCAWRCPHHRCEKSCFEVCMRPPCDVPCPIILKCGHPCIGLCGEPCPSKCRVCHAQTKEIITQMELGEFEESDRFIQLEDCRHIFEVEGLDQWMKSDEAGQRSDGSVAIKLKECPECRTPIFKTTRYSNSVKATLGKVEQVKSKVLGYDFLKKGDDHLAKKEYAQALQSYTAALNRNQRLMAAHFQTGYVFYLKEENARAVVHFCFIVERSSFGRRLENLIRRVEVDDSGGSSDKALHAVKRHLARFPGRADNALAIKAMLQLASALGAQRKFSEVKELCDVVLETNPDDSIAKTLRERAGRGEMQMVIQAMSGERGLETRGHWFQCPNGHYYTIGECGGATQQSKCPDCDATVGGGSHRLAAGNRPSNIDGADPASYVWRGEQQF